MDSSNLANNLDDLQKIFNTRMQNYEEKLQRVAVEAGPGHPDVSSLSSEYHDFKTFVMDNLAVIKAQLNLLALGQDRHETVMRRKVLLFHGVPEKQNENVQDTILRVMTGQMALVDINKENIAVCHRLGYSRSKTRPVLVRFTDMAYRHLVWDNKTSLKSTGITISEFLTRTRHRAFMAARHHFGIKNCWSVEGKIVVMLPDKTRRKMESLAEVEALITAHPSTSGDSQPPKKAKGNNTAASSASNAKGVTTKAPALTAAGKSNRRA